MTNLVLLEKLSIMVDIFLQQKASCNPLLGLWQFGFFTSNYVPALRNEAFAFINTQSSKIQAEHLIMIAN